MQKLLLHICCGPCATHVVDILREHYIITGYFYNPNIYPEEEYTKRLSATQKAAKRLGIRLIEGKYNQQTFFDAVKGFEDEPEGGERCIICCRLRLSSIAEYAAENSFDCFATTLTVGPQKKASLINPIGTGEADQAGVLFIDGDWKKQDGFKRSCELSRKYGLYRQNYCGCLFSMRGKTMEKP